MLPFQYPTFRSPEKTKMTSNKKSSRLGKMTYYFGQTRTDGRNIGKEILGGKGANLAEMTGIGLPVPPGFTITTNVCDAYYKNNEQLPSSLATDVKRNIATLEKELGRND